VPVIETMIKILTITTFVLLVFTSAAFAQDKSYDSCIVGVSNVIRNKDGDLDTSPIREIGRFEVRGAGEEDRITRAFRLPNTKLFVIASIFYTDESMATEKTADSVSLELMISRDAKRDILQSLNFADAETPNNPFDIARVQMIVRVNSRQRIIMMECKRMKGR
jgi:hypothetical protein